MHYNLTLKMQTESIEVSDTFYNSLIGQWFRKKGKII